MDRTSGERKNGLQTKYMMASARGPFLVLLLLLLPLRWSQQHLLKHLRKHFTGQHGIFNNLAKPLTLFSVREESIMVPAHVQGHQPPVIPARLGQFVVVCPLPIPNQ